MRRFVIVAAIAVVVICMDFAARYYVEQHLHPKPAIPLLHGEYNALDSIWDSPSGDYPLPKDYTSAQVNYQSGYRNVIGQPTSYKRTIWLIGASQLTDENLTDTQTIASQLQLLLPDVRIMNAGMQGANVGMMVSRLEDLPVAQGDIVILLGGSLEAQDVFFTASDDRGSLLTDGLCNLLLRRPIGFTMLMCYQAVRDVPGLWDERLWQYANDAYQPYARGIDRARRITSEKHATFIHVLAPFCACIATQDYPGIHRAYIAFYSLARHDTDALDLSQLLDERDFLSTFHVNAHGARIVAQALYEVLK